MGGCGLANSLITWSSVASPSSVGLLDPGSKSMHAEADAGGLGDKADAGSASINAM
jgi:hypothetical protein